MKFLSEVLNTEKFPLTVMDRPIESETTKIVENSYRATILAFLNEWSLFAERNGVDLIKVIKAIKMRPTHSNMIFPGPGIGGYCLPKDGGLGYWAYKHILGFEDRRPGLQDHADGHRHQRHPRPARGRADPRRPAEHGHATSPAPRCCSAAPATARTSATPATAAREMVVRKLTEMGAEMRVHDPYVDHWYELEKPGRLPRAGPLAGRGSSATRRT